MFQKVKTYLLLALILVLAGGLRFYVLSKNPPALFSDEVDIGYQVKSFLATGRDYYGNYLPLQFHSFSDVRTALPIYATVLVSKIPGLTIDYAIRLTPAIFSLFSILGIYFLVNEILAAFGLTGDKNKSQPGLWAALVLSLTPWHFTYSRIGFELSMLLAFFIWGLTFYFFYLRQRKLWQLIKAAVLLGLTPMIYSTAKLAILFLPFLFFTIPIKSRLKLLSKENLIFLVVLFAPLLVIMMSGGAAQRFSELAIFTDPTLSSEVNFARQADLGPNLKVGSSPNLVSKLVHNRPLMITTAFVKNLFGPTSFDYLFVAGDSNLRHAISGWGMLLKIMVIPLLVGLYWTARLKGTNFIKFLFVFSILAILPSALTRDGATHSSRTMLLLLPLVIVMALGVQILFSHRRVIGLLLILLLFLEFFLYQHDYWFRYPYQSERSWDAGMKEMILSGLNYPDKSIVYSKTFEPPLIFYLYYSDFPPSKFQQLIKKGSYQTPIPNELNLEGVRFSDLPVYFALIKSPQTKNPLKLKNAIYFLNRDEAKNIIPVAILPAVPVIKLPSGEPLFYRQLMVN